MRFLNCVYKFLNKDNEIIYIGKAKDLENRLMAHNHLPKECYEERESVEFTMFETEDDMDLAERYYIPKLKPKYNTEFANRELTICMEELDYCKKWYKYSKDLEINTEESEVRKIKLFKLNLEIRKLTESIDILLGEEFSYNIRKSEVAELTEKLNKQKTIKLRMIMGESEFRKLDKYRISQYIKYNTYNDKDTLDIIIKAIIDKAVKQCTEQILEFGYYKYSDFLGNAYYDFGCNSVRNAEWTEWIDEQKHILAQKSINEIENILIDKFGEFYEETIIQDVPYMWDHSIKYPQAILIKKVA